MSVAILDALFLVSVWLPLFMLALHNLIGDLVILGRGSMDGGNSGQYDLSTNGSISTYVAYQTRRFRRLSLVIVLPSPRLDGEGKGRGPGPAR
jgi:hypothetical protein